MQAKLNIVLKLANEIGMAVVSGSPFKILEAMEETDRLRLSPIELMDEHSVDDELCDELIQGLNDIKKKYFELKILDSGKNISSLMELKELKSRGIEKLINIPNETLLEVRKLEGQIFSEQNYLTNQRKKSKPTIVEENNLLPNLNFRVGVSLLLSLFAGFFMILGYIASTDERFYDKNFGYWSMLIGGLGLLVTLNIVVIRVVQAVRFQMNKKQAIEDLGSKHMLKHEADFESLDNKLRSRIFSLESIVYSDSCRKTLITSMVELKELKQRVLKHFK